MAAEHIYEVEVKVSAAGQPDAYVRREYHTDKASTDDAAQEVWSGVSGDVKARMAPVNESR